MTPFAEAWAKIAFHESERYDLVAERATRSSDIYHRFKDASLTHAPSVRAAAVALPTDGPTTRGKRVTKAQGRVWDIVLLSYSALQRAHPQLPPPPPPPPPRPSLAAPAAPDVAPTNLRVLSSPAPATGLAAQRMTRSAFLHAAGVPRLLRLGEAGPQWGYLLGLDRSELRELEAQLLAAVVYRTDTLACNRTCEYYSLASLPALVARYNAAAGEAGYAHKVGALSVVAALPIAPETEDSAPQQWHQDAGAEQSFTVCIALSPITSIDGPMQYERGRSGAVEFEVTGPAGTQWMFLQKSLRHRGSPNHGHSPRRVSMVEFERVV